MIAFYQSTIGKKFVMAVTGVVLFGFLVGHMLGNLKAFRGEVHGEHKLDVYARFLREMGSPLFNHGEVLWAARGILLLALILHVHCATALTKRNRESRPGHYHDTHDSVADMASKSMWISGPLIGAYVVMHLLHLTFGKFHPAFVPGHVYDNVVAGFQQIWAVIAYVAAVVILGMHLYHGLWSFLQTLGLSNHRCRNKLKTASRWIAILLVLGYVAVPLSVTFGVLQ